MYYVWHDGLSETKAKITEIALEGYEGQKTEEEMAKAVKMHDFPRPEHKEGFYAVEYINPQTKEYIYDYEPIPPTQEQKIYNIERVLELAQQAIDELLLAKA